jgi:hypothetical protein
MTISLPVGHAGLPQVPVLYYVPSRMLNAFAVGQSEEVEVMQASLLTGYFRNGTEPRPHGNKQPFVTNSAYDAKEGYRD